MITFNRPSFLLFPFPQWWTSPLLKLPEPWQAEADAFQAKLAQLTSINIAQQKARDRRNGVDVSRETAQQSAQSKG